MRPPETPSDTLQAMNPPDRPCDLRAPGGRPLLLRAAFAFLGFSALAVQVLLMRELMVAWRGNEMSFGVTLSVWLALTEL